MQWLTIPRTLYRKTYGDLKLQLRWIATRRVEQGPLEPGPVQGISMPRSGHHWMVNNLAAYQPEFRYCERYTQDGCCQSIPCTDLNIHLAKSHDLDARAIKTNRRKFLIQIREPVPSIVSHFELAVAHQWVEQSDARWRRFAIDEARFRNRFAAKWLLNLPRHAMVVHYEDARAAPAVIFGDLCRFVFGEEPDAGRVASIARNVTGARKLEDFRFYDQAFFESLFRRTEAAKRLTDTFRRL